jgi:NAD(P)-dependent dehydrogenase (short-subunit alcohol dehydrogenase family)
VNRLQGKVALITGAGSGIGKSVSRIFSEEGAHVVIAEIDRRLGLTTEAMVKEQGGDALFVETDVTDEDSAQRAVAATVERFGASRAATARLSDKAPSPTARMPLAGSRNIRSGSGSRKISRVSRFFLRPTKRG